MAFFRNIQMSFWTDAKISENFTPDDKLFYLYLMTNPHTSLCGCYEIGVKQMADETGFTREQIGDLIIRLTEVHDVIRYSVETREMILLNWHKYNWTESDKVKASIQKGLQKIKCEVFRTYLEEILNGSDTAYIGYEKGIDRVSIGYAYTFTFHVSCLVSSLSSCLVSTGKEDRGIGEEEKPKQKRETQETIFDRLIESQNVGMEMENVLREWLKYKTERRETYKETGMKNMITQVQNAVHRFGEVAVMDRIRQAMANTWKGMNLDKMVEQKAPERRMDNVNSMIDRWAVASEEYERRKYDTG